MTYNISFEICSLVFMGILIYYYYTRNRLMDMPSSLFGAYMILTETGIVLNIAASLLLEYGKTLPVAVHELVNTLNLIAACMIPSTFFLHIRILCGRRKLAFLNKYFLYLPAVAGVATLCLNARTHWYFHFDAEMNYQRGWATYFIFLNAFFYLVAAAVCIFRNRREIKQRKLRGVIVIPITGFLFLGMQLLFERVLLYGFCFTICTFITYLIFENPNDYLDKMTGTLNKKAFLKVIRRAVREKKPFAAYVAALDDFKRVNDVLGMESGDEIIRSIALELVNAYGLRNIFWFGGDIFVILEREKGIPVKEEELRRMIDKAGRAENAGLSLTAGICKMKCDCWKKEEKDSLRIVENGIAAVKALGKGSYVELDEGLIYSIQRQEAIERAILEAVEREQFEIYYQPIYTPGERIYQSLEALARLQVEGYGYIPPDEFIQLAERNGSIIQLGLLVLKTVCQYMKENRLWERGIRFVEVNVSVVQCIQEDFVEKVLSILEEYDIAPSMLCLELTESAATQSGEKLSEHMERLREKGISFALDDYGSGYSNMNYIVDLPFSIVKLDKHLVWAAFTDENSRNILEYTILMFKRIRLEIVSEGVETQLQAQVLEHAGVKYFQGFLYAKPMPGKELLAFLEERRQELVQAETPIKEQEAETVQEETKNRTQAGKWKSIALCVSSMQQEEVKNFTEALCTAAKKEGFRLMIFNTFELLQKRNNQAKGGESIYSLVNFELLSALVVMPCQLPNEEVLNDLLKRAGEKQVPVIAVNKSIEGCYNVLDDIDGSFERIVRHVIERHGVTRVHFIAGIKGNEYSEARLSILKKVLKENGIPFGEDQLDYGDFWEGPTIRIMDGFFAKKKELPQAFICANDAMAIAVCKKLVEHGVRVPEDVIVTGFDGIERERYCSPRLTTAAQDAKKAAETVIKIIRSLEQGKAIKREWRIPHKIRFSQSCGCEPVSVINMNETIKEVYEHLTYQKNFEVRMYEMVSELTDNHTLEECTHLLEPYMRELPFDYLAVCVTQEYIKRLEKGEEQKAGEENKRPFAEGMYRIACKAGETYQAGFEPFDGNRILPELETCFDAEQKLLFLPLHFQETVIGYLACSFKETEVNYINLLRFNNYLNQAFVIIRRQRSEEALNTELRESNTKLQDLYERDPMSGLYNRDGFENRVGMAVQEMVGMCGEASLIFVSPDMLSDAGERLTDPVSEEEAEWFAKTLIKCGRGEIIAARTAADAFVVLVVAVSGAELKARAYLEQVKKQMKKHNDQPERKVQLSFHYGIETAVMDRAFSLDEMIERAEKKGHESRDGREQEQNFSDGNGFGEKAL